MKYIIRGIIAIVLLIVLIFTFNYYSSYSDGYRAGKLIKFSHKGVIIKTWEGQLSQGVGGDQLWDFSVEDKDKEVIQQLIDLQGQNVKIKYVERFWKISWFGDTKHFAREVTKNSGNIGLE
jgi:hypothetical protein